MKIPGGIPRLAAGGGGVIDIRTVQGTGSGSTSAIRYDEGGGVNPVGQMVLSSYLILPSHRARSRPITF